MSTEQLTALPARPAPVAPPTTASMKLAAPISPQCEHETEILQLREALNSSRHLGNAVGVVMATLRCDADAAWGLLSAASQHTNVKVREVAQCVLDLTASGASEVTPAVQSGFISSLSAELSRRQNQA